MEETKWALTMDWSQWKLLPIQRQTAKTVFVLEHGRTRQLMATNVRAMGDKDTLLAVLHRLVSSDALYSDETRKAGLRRNERNASIIASIQ